MDKRRLFLDAAADGDLEGVDAWLLSEPKGDVNVTMGEGWTALLYAVAHTRLAVVRRLLEEATIDLNATSMMGSSALTLALTRKNNSLVTLLLTNGASRSTIPNNRRQEVEFASWVRAEVRRMLSPDWAVVWSPTLHRHFPPAEREKCRLVVFANALAMRQLGRAAHESTTLLSALADWTDEAVQRFWWLLAALTDSSIGATQPVRWRYLAPPLVYHIIEYAVFLW